MNLFKIKTLDDKYYMNVFGKRLNAAFTHGEDVYLYDTTGKKFTDFLAGIAVNSLGYSNEGFKNALKSQIDKIIHTSNYFYNAPQAELAKLLCEKTDMDKVFFANSGAEANECALKLAKKAAFDKGVDNPKFITLKNSFHGRTVATVTATGQKKFYTPYLPGGFNYEYIEANDINAAKNAVKNEVCSVIIELIQGEGGVLPLDVDYVKFLKQLCEQTGAMLIVDEIQTGMGRTGTFLCCEQYGIKPDILTLAKSLGNGVPIGACLATKEAASSFNPGDHGSTFGGNLLACAAALYVTQAVDDEMLKQVNEIGNYFKLRLELLKREKPDKIAEVRGLGLMLGMELKSDVQAGEVRNKMFENGFLTATAGFNTLRFLPPYIIKPDNIDELIENLRLLL